MRIKEITPEWLQSLDDDAWDQFSERFNAAALTCPEATLEMVLKEGCRRGRRDVERAIYLDKIRFERFPEMGPRQFPDTFEEWWAETGKKKYEADLAAMKVKFQPGSPN